MRVLIDELRGLKPEQLAAIRKKSGYTEMLRALEAEVVKFGRPVLFVHGDSHIFRIDKPLFNTKNRRGIEYFTRVEVIGTPETHWVRIVVDPNKSGLFTITPEMVGKNLVNHLGK